MTTAAAPRVDVERFADQGYLLVEGLLDPQLDLDPVVREYEALLDAVADEWRAAGTLRSAYADLPFAQRLVGPAIFDLITSPRLVDAVARLIGPEVLSNPIQHVRIKPPEALLSAELRERNTMVSAVEWHQDQGVALPEVDGTEMLTVWFPVFESTVENGCLCVVPESHRRGLLTHCPSRPGQAFDLRIPESIRGAGGFPVPMERGSVLFLHRRTMHSSLRNLSDGVRWSFDLRYQPIGQPTGRPWLPSFVVRSAADPASEVHDWRTWAGLWQSARDHLAAHPEAMKPRRWTGTEPACA